ncbi:winged helix-turn-helix domain-containing protein [Enterococcus pallens]|uniref:OmpR/PhoB-type domain-containing protein n=1 Tax=Enterococcus pallens ATCC BAA-351 TaxID=1158607 RepID=R2PSX9_9ENTE|nr:helix-turn-helix domain-containing protein [Enterococcus pallens]EOH86398.1 hypothetical protein UAU_05213 [Enterococcus pallens ATCC BAA-351]EOU09423.1 hypothetical protein I588_05156 [Enterococcus pallens ATCC BAA-351]OJG77580.1 hypothetical protein RV10_GL002414 [Enterococcus pallens]
MQHVLILTKNTLSEENMVRKLQQLNFETFCSTDLLYHLQQRTARSFLSYFQWVIFSETLCDEEVEQLLRQTKGQSLLTLRITESQPTEEEQTEWKNYGLTDWLLSEATFTAIREKISCLQKQLQKGMVTGSQILNFPIIANAPGNNGLEALIKSLSKTEKRVLQNLIQAHPGNDVLSRKDLCEQLWCDGETASNLSQLSCLINKLKRKLELHGISGESITTLWGRGYKLSNEFYEYWVENNQQDEDVVQCLVTK